MDVTAWKFTRRGWLKGSAAAGLGLLLGVGGCANPREPKPALVTSGLVTIGPATDFPAGTVSTKLMDLYGIMVANDSGTVLVIRPVCTYAACIVEWKEDQNQFVCPCHGCRYNILGQVLKGPAKKALKAVPAVRTPLGTLAVNLDALYR